jgi:hypothetical protein
MAYSIYSHFLNDYQIATKFNPGYVGSDKFGIIDKLKSSSKSSLDGWFIEFRSRLGTDLHFHLSIVSWSSVKYACFKKKEAYDRYTQHQRQNPSGALFKRENWLPFLREKGFTETRTSKTRYLRTTLERFIELMSGDEEKLIDESNNIQFSTLK